MIKVLQILSAGVTGISTAILAFSIPRSSSRNGGGLQTPRRRILFGLCTSSTIQSLAFIIEPFTGLGSHASCRAQQALVLLGADASLVYTLGLSFFQLQVVKYGVSNKKFAQGYERLIHLAAVVLPAASIAAGLALDVFHPMSNDHIWWCSPIFGCTSENSNIYYLLY